MAKNTYQRQKDQKDQAKKRKKAEKLQRKQEKGSSGLDDDQLDVEVDENGDPIVSDDDTDDEEPTATEN
jgi:hypothetical protein